jgi:hypothetical protein
VTWIARAGLLCLFAALAFWLYMGIVGSVWVFNRSGDDVHAVILVGDREQQMLRLPGGTFFAFPEQDSEIEVRCRDGSSARGGYVTRHLQTSITVVAASPCKVVEHL